MAVADDSRDQLHVNWLPRLLAAILALGGGYWGLILSPWLFQLDVSPLALVVFGPGYLVTLGYVVRAVSTPSLSTRRFIWIASIIVQGGWLGFALWGIAEKVAAGRMPNEPVLFEAWWALALVLSMAALLAEGVEQTTRCPVNQLRLQEKEQP
ncbi:MAG TPA: hypothetical protein VGF55_15745 [Gemmataceae bacterium]|jgi:hypothetical protein